MDPRPIACPGDLIRRPIPAPPPATFTVPKP